MPSNYPTGLDAFTTGTLTGVVSGSDHGNKGDAINKIEAELGINPSGAAATVVARLNSVESDYVPVEFTMAGAAAPNGFVENPVTFNGVVDPIWQSGYNMALLPNQVAAEPEFYTVIEGKYRVGANQEGYTDGVAHNTCEFYVNYTSPDGTTVVDFRPLFVNALRDDNDDMASKITFDIGTGGFPKSRFNIQAGASDTIVGITDLGIFVTAGKDLKVGTARVMVEPATADSHVSFPKAGNFGTTAVLNTLYLVKIQVREPTTLTGLVIFNNGTVNGNVITSLWDAAGAKVRESNSTAQSGTFTGQAVPFQTSVVVQPGAYVIGVIYSSSTATIDRVTALGGATTPAQGSFANPASITPPTAAQINQVPNMGTY